MSPQLRLFPQKSLLGCHFHVSLSISTRNLWQFPFKKGCHFLFLVAKSAIILGNRSKKLSIYSSSFKATLIFCELFWEVFLNVSNHLKIGIKSDKIVNFKVIFKKILWVIKKHLIWVMLLVFWQLLCRLFSVLSFLQKCDSWEWICARHYFCLFIGNYFLSTSFVDVVFSSFVWLVRGPDQHLLL